MAKPKLALIPASQGSELFSVLPSSGVGDFDFTRSGSATRINSQGLIETVGNGVSRLNYPMIDGKVVGCPHHILEPQSTNLITHSSELTNSSWVKTNTGTASAPSITSNYSISPDGTQNADRVIFNLNGGTANGDISQVSVTIGSVSSASYTNSVYIKSNTANNYDLVVTDPSGGHIVKNISTEWQRFDNPRENVTNASFRIRLRGDEGTSDYADVSIWGAQLEQQLFATSLINTSGSATTRNAETCTGAGDAATFNDSEGVLMANVKYFTETDSFNRSITISNNTINNRLQITLLANGELLVLYQDGSGIQTIQTTNKPTQFNKVALSYGSNSLRFYLNGIEIENVLGNFSSMNSLKTLRLDNTISEDFYGSTKEIAYYDTSLTDLELETLTSWTSFSDMANGQQYSII